MIGDIFQPTHLLFILVVALLVLGPKRLPEAGRALGGAIRDFKGAMTGEHDQPSGVVTQTSATPTQGTPTQAAPAQATPDWAQTVQAEEASQAEPGTEATQAEQPETVHPIG